MLHFKPFRLQYSFEYLKTPHGWFSKEPENNKIFETKKVLQ